MALRNQKFLNFMYKFQDQFKTVSQVSLIPKY